MIETSLPQSEPVLLPGRSSGRQARSVIGYSLLTAVMIVMQFPIFVPAAVLHCAIRHGRRAGWAVLVLAAVLVAFFAATTQVSTPEVQKTMWSVLAAFVLTLTVPAMAAEPMVARGEKFGRVLMFVLAGSLVGLALTEVAFQAFLGFSPYASQLAQTTEMGREVLQFYRDNKMPADSIATMERVSVWSTYLLPAQLLCTISVSYILSLLMLGRLAAWHDHAARRTDNEALRAYLFRNFAMPEWLLFAFIFGGLLTPLAGGLLQKVAANTLFVVLFLYFVQGLAIFRSSLIAIGAGPAGTAVAWLMLTFLLFTGVSEVLLTVAGLFDSFFDFRHFKKRKDDSHESHSD
jgi:Predicted membrane protein (DUF2232)